MPPNSTCCVLLGKNFRTYHRFEILAYMCLPLLMVHLVWLRSGDNQENMAHCMKIPRKNGTLGDVVNLNPLYNAMESSTLKGPEKIILLFTNNQAIESTLIPALKSILKLRDVLAQSDEQSMENKLTNGDFLCGIVWKTVTKGGNDMDIENSEITIRFPSALRTIPTDLWETPKRESDVDKPLYVNEGFLQVMYAIVLYLSQVELSNPEKIYNNDNGVAIISRPFYTDYNYQRELDTFVEDPIQGVRRDILGLYLSTLFIYPFIRLIMHMGREKKMQLKDLMSIAGANRFCQYFSWFWSTFIILSLINLVTVIILKAPLCDNGNVLNCSSFTALFVFFTVWSVAGICFCFLVHSLFQNIIVAAFLIAFITVISFVLYRYFSFHILVLRIFYFLTFQLGFLSGIKQILLYEDIDQTGLQWFHYIITEEPTFDEPTRPTQMDLERRDIFYFFWAIPMMMLVGAILCLILCFIFEELHPGRYGIARIKKFNRSTKVYNNLYAEDRASQISSPAIVQTHSLQKFQRRKAPLRDFSMNMYDDQITVILGLSDSGKSAVINSISGSIPPDSGSVRIDNRDVIKNTRKARQSLGLSPQHDALFGSLTVLQHMNFFSSLRKVRGKTKRHAIDKYLCALDLLRVRHIKSRNLSRSDKRKLSVVCAFCGNPGIILLDEPSERMEPCERRLLWDLLQSEKRCRTIIVATYQVEEADMLGDRVAILCDGELIFNGTSTFLKNTYGSGYQLVCSQGEICQEPQITSVVQKYVPETRASSDKPFEVSYNIPQANCCSIIPLLTDLEACSNYINMGAIGIGTTPILEKFVNATSADYNGCNAMKSDINPNCIAPEPDECLLRGARLWCNQWRAMLLKKSFHIRHNCLLFFPLLLLLPIAFGVLSSSFFRWTIPISYSDITSGTFASQEPVKLYLSIYPNCKVAFVRDVNDENPLIKLLKDKIQKDSGCTSEDITMNELQTNEKTLNDKYIFAIQMKNCEYQIYYSRKWYHSEAVAAAMMGYIANCGYLDLFCPGYEGKNVEMPLKDVSFINHPYLSLQLMPNTIQLEIDCKESGSLYLKLLCVNILAGFFAAYIIRERRLGFKLLQQVEGINMATFWLAHLIWDWTWLSLLTLTLLIIMTMCLGKTFDDEFVGYIIVMALFNLALLPFLYALMYFFKRPIFAWLLPIGLLFILAIPFELAAPDIPFGFLYAIPTYSAISGVHSVCIHASSFRVCQGRNSEMYQGCEVHIHWSCMFHALPFLLALILTAIVYFSLLLLIERGSFCGSRSRSRLGGGGCDDSGIQNMTRNELRNYTLILENVTRYGKTPIKDVSFGLKPMDVLGLVGERSGKTSLNKAIVGTTRLAGGRILVKGINVNKFSKFKCYKYMGYCPQENCFEPAFTGRENLKIFCLIRGIKPSKVREVSDELAENLNFKEHLDKRSIKYTVSDKRKLSTAIAVIGTPPLILLDEPTAGIEKAHRADVLDVLKSVNECGSTILLSSNNVEDFQSLCTRLGLLKRGKLIGIGPVESFKNSPTPGLILLMKIRTHTAQQLSCDRPLRNEQASVQKITAFLLKYFEGVYLLETIQGEVLYYIQNSTIPIAKAFEIIEQHRYQLNVLDFFLRQENMELTFVSQNFRILR